MAGVSGAARVLVLGGTSEASRLAALLAAAGWDAIFSYAGRVAQLLPQPLPTRVGGFGGVAGLMAYLAAERITHVIDATHPFAIRMSLNARLACASAGVPLLVLERPPWAEGPADRWIHVPTLEAALAALPDAPARIFLAIGRQAIEMFAQKPQHFYLLRAIEAPESISLPHHALVAGRGPFTAEGDEALMRAHAISLVVAKNSGGRAAAGKLVAAQRLGLPVVMVARPDRDPPGLPARTLCASPEAALAWLDHGASPARDRGV